MKIGWIGSVAFQAFTDGGRELVFDLAEGQSLPPEFKEGDAVEIVNRPDPSAMFVPEINEGYYEVIHVASGQTIKVMHRTSSWRFE